jgi:hypothetical protein
MGHVGSSINVKTMRRAVSSSCVRAAAAPLVKPPQLRAAASTPAATAAVSQPPQQPASSSPLTATVRRGGVELRGGGLRGDLNGQPLWLAPEWLLENAKQRRHATGQSTVRLEDEATWAGDVTAAELVGGVLRCAISTVPEGAGLTGSDEGCRAVEVEVDLQATLARTGVLRMNVSQPVKALTSADQMKRLKYADVVREAPDAKTPSAAVKDFFGALVRDGIVLLEGCPTDSEGTIEACAKAAAPVSGLMKTLYGRDFKVDRVPTSEGPRNNIAYTGEFLDLHCDLSYYESMPGLQMLLCRQFDDDVTGGESFFVDAFAAAQDLRTQRPDAFEVLTRIPRPFCKQDPNRTVPANYYYGAPHITVSSVTGVVTKVVWSPAFEAPFPLWFGEGAMRQYFEARRAFAAVLLDWRKDQSVRLRLRPGECIVWNQVRVLHGREAFTEPQPGGRRLHGAYCNIDDFASTARHVLGNEMPFVALGNRSEL